MKHTATVITTTPPRDAEVTAEVQLIGKKHCQKERNKVRALAN